MVQNFCLTVPKVFVDESFSVSEGFDFRRSFLHEKGISRFDVKNLLFHMTEKLRKGSLLFQKFSDIGKIMDQRRGSITPFCQKFFVSQCRKTSEGAPPLSQISNEKNEGQEGLGGGSIITFCQNFLFHSAEKIRRGALECFTNFGYRKTLCFGGLCHEFLSKSFCVTALKSFVGEPLCAVFQKNSGSQESFWIREGQYRKLPSKSFCLTVPEVLLGNPSVMCFRKNPIAKKVSG